MNVVMQFRRGVMRGLSLGLAVMAFSAPVRAQQNEAASSVYRQAKAYPENRIAFDNGGGLFGSGVCWWHSRLQRSFLYLAEFNSSAEKPTEREAKRLVKKLIRQRERVEIPGYSNVRDFTRDYEKTIQKLLNRWMIRDSVLGFAYVRGLSGQARMKPEKLKPHLDRIFARYQEAKRSDDLIWLLLQEKGLIAHASLLVHMEPTAEGGYYMEMIDSNYSQDTIQYRYQPGDRMLSPLNPVGYHHWVAWVPHLGFDRDLKRIKRAKSKTID